MDYHLAELAASETKKRSLVSEMSHFLFHVFEQQRVLNKGIIYVAITSVSKSGIKKKSKLNLNMHN